MGGRYANGKDGGGSGMFWHGCYIVTILAILGLSIATTVGVFRGFSALAPMSPKSFGMQPTLCGGPLGDNCGGGDKCCGGICRDLTTFKGVCQDTPPEECNPAAIDCPEDTFCCANGNLGGKGRCRPFDWPGQCGTFFPKPVIPCDPIGGVCPSQTTCCHHWCRDPGHPACA